MELLERKKPEQPKKRRLVAEAMDETSTLASNSPVAAVSRCSPGADAVIRAGCVVSVAAAVRSPQGIQSAGENVRWKTCLADVFFEVDVSFVKSDEMEKLEGMETVPASHFPHSQVLRPVSCLTNAHPTSIKPRDETPNLHIQTRDDDDGMITTRAHQMITHVALVVVKPVSHIKGLPRAASPLRHWKRSAPPRRFVASQVRERPPRSRGRRAGLQAIHLARWRRLLRKDRYSRDFSKPTRRDDSDGTAAREKKQ